jgi:ketosteroid isomerase-like protein
VDRPAHGNVERIRDVFRAFAEKDGITVGRLLGDDAVWRVPGRSTMAGEYRGRHEIFAFLRRTGELTEGTYRAELKGVWGGDGVVAALYRATGVREGRALDIDQVLVFRFDGEELREVLAVPSDPDAFDGFWG